MVDISRSSDGINSAVFNKNYTKMPPQNLSSSTLHTSVMLQESVDSIFEDDGSLLSTGRIYVDATAGLGGHSEYILSKLATNDRLIMIDRDPENLDLASARLSDSRVTPVCASFGDIASILGQLEIPSIDGIIYDLGVSSVHYDDPERGFSIRENGPLDMRFNRRSSELVPASEWLMRVGERDLFIGMRDYADEPKAYFVAKAIVAARTLKAITTTGELKAIIEAASFDPKSALRCFQAIRIMVNNEFGEIQKSIPAAVQALRS
jgi:16S rRNA (cytosine1402-N4)-methyltransferase